MSARSDKTARIRIDAGILKSNPDVLGMRPAATRMSLPDIVRAPSGRWSWIVTRSPKWPLNALIVADGWT